MNVPCIEEACLGPDGQLPPMLLAVACRPFVSEKIKINTKFACQSP